MTIEKKYLKKLKKLKEEYIHITPKEREEYCLDEEAYHIQTDTLIICLIKELGYKELAEAYEEARQYFWYS